MVLITTVHGKVVDKIKDQYTEANFIKLSKIIRP